MNDDLGKKIQQIAELLGQDSVPENVKELVALLASSMASKEKGGDRTVPQAESTGENDRNVPSTVSPVGSGFSGAPERNVPPADESLEQPQNSDAFSNTELIDKARNALSRMNTGNDPRINLLHAIKPFMNSKRQKKIGSCIQLLQVAGLSRLLNEHDSNPR